MRRHTRYAVECENERCRQKFHVTESRMHQRYCSRECLEASRLLDKDAVQELAQQGYSRRKAAELMDVPYPTFFRKLQTQGLNGFFLGRGKYHSSEHFGINRGADLSRDHDFSEWDDKFNVPQSKTIH